MNKSSLEQVQHQTNESSLEWVRLGTSPALNESTFEWVHLWMSPDLNPDLNESSFEWVQLLMGLVLNKLSAKWVQCQMSPAPNESCIKWLQQQSSCLKLKEVTSESLESQEVYFKFCSESIVDSHSIAIVWICTLDPLKFTWHLNCRICHLGGHSVPDSIWKN